MQQIKRRLIGLTIAVLVLLSVRRAGQSRADIAQSPEVHHPIELTDVDAFANRNWNAEDIRIIGFFLGMAKTEADETARKQNLVLNCLNWCGVCNEEKTLCSGIGLHFGNDGNIDAMTVGRPLQEASPALRKFSVTQRFKGKTYLFFHHYSNTLRVRLLGPESDRKEDSAVRETTYSYPQLGLEISVDLSANKNIPESQADLDVTFKRPSAQNVKIDKPRAGAR